jgi:transcriptional regulator with XRE-family HTH domain
MAKSKISKAKVAKLKADITAGVKQTDLAKKYGVSRSLVSEVANDRAHKDVPWPEGKPAPKIAGGQRKPIEDHDPTDKRILELEADLIHLKAERDRARTHAKANAKLEGLFKSMQSVVVGLRDWLNPRFNGLRTPFHPAFVFRSSTYWLTETSPVERFTVPPGVRTSESV